MTSIYDMIGQKLAGVAIIMMNVITIAKSAASMTCLVGAVPMPKAELQQSGKPINIHN